MSPGCYRAQSVLPLPPAPEFPHPVRHLAQEVQEPEFDPNIHLDLARCSPTQYVLFVYVTTFPLAAPTM